MWAKLSELQSRLSDSLSNRNDPNIAGFASSFVGTKSFDESSIRRIVDSALALYDADKTGMADYALESQGWLKIVAWFSRGGKCFILF